MKRVLVTAIALLSLAACQPEPKEPFVPVESVTETKLDVGKRIEVKVSASVTKEECDRVVQRYKRMAGVDGQVVVMKPATKPKAIAGQYQPFCVNNMNGQPTKLNDQFWE